MIAFLILAGFSYNAFASPPLKVVRGISSQNYVIACEAQVLNTLSNLEMPLEWYELPLQSGTKTALHVLKSDTEKKGVSFEMVLSKEKTLLQRFSQDHFTSYEFRLKDNCKPHLSFTEIKNPAPTEKTFTDADLKKLAIFSKTEKKSVVFYTWSPHMPLSIKGVHELVKLSAKKSLKVVILADPFAQEQTIREIAQRQQWPVDYQKKINSEALIGQNILIHYPSLLVMKNGEFKSFVRPGYDDPSKMKSLLSSWE